MALAVLLLLFSVAEIKRAEAYYYPPYNIPPGPPPNYSEIDTLYFLGAPVLPDPPPDSGGFYIWVDATGAWNIASHLYVRGNNIEQYHGSILALMSSPPAPGVNVFATNFELTSSGNPSGCYRQNDRWGWYQWDENLYEIWWDVSTRESGGDANDFMKVRVLGCAIDFNLWSSGHDHGFSAGDIYLGESMTRLMNISGYYDSYPGISDPYEYQHYQNRNISFFNKLAGTGHSYNNDGLIIPGQTYPCGPIDDGGLVSCGQLYGDRFSGAFVYEGNGIQFSATCVHDPCQDNTAPQLQGPFAYSVFQCSPTQYCFDVNYFDFEDNFHHFELLSGPGTIDSLSGLVCFTPAGGVSDYLFTVMAIDECGMADTADYAVEIIINSPPVAITPLNQIIPACNLGQICIPGFTASDPDNNLVSKTLLGGTLHGDTACFTPVAGANTLKLIATDNCGAADTSITVVTVDLNRPPVAVTPSNQNMFVCNLNQVCLPGFSASDPDGNLASTILIGGTLQGNNACFTPVVGPNTLTLIATDACGAADTSVTVVTVGLNRPPVAIAPANQNMFVCNLSQICIPGFMSSDPDGNIVSRVLQGGSLHGDTACFMPAPGPNTIRLIVTDACGLADTAEMVVTIAVNQPPVAVTPSNQNMFVCNLNQVCLPGFSASDPDGNLASTILIGGTLQGNNACFTPVVGPNTLTLIATDACGAADTSVTVVTVTLNQAPVATVHVDTSYFLCALSQICLRGFSASDVDNNISTVTLIGGTLSGDTACFTPIAGINTIKLIVTDACGAADTGVASITVTLNSLPIASSPADTSLSRPDLSQVCLPGFTATDPDGNLVSRVILGGTLNGDTACFTPVQGLNILTLICTDACGAADTSVTEVTVNLAISLSIAGAPPVFIEEVADSFLIAVTGGDPGSLAFVTDFTAHAGTPSRFSTSYNSPNFKTVITFDYLGEFSSAESSFAYRVIASDNFSADTLDLSLVVNDNNRLPEITADSNYTVIVDHPLNFMVSANDLDTDNILTLVKASGPGTFAGASGPPPVSDIFSWTPTDADLPGSPYTVKFAAGDGRGGVDTAIVTITVSPEGAPTIGLVYSPSTFYEGRLDSIVFTATDPEGDALGGFGYKFLSPESTFTGASFAVRNDTAFLRLTFNYLGNWSSTGSPFPLRLMGYSLITDADSAYLNIAVVVSNTNRKPELTVTGPNNIVAGNSVTLNAVATDLDTDDLMTLTASGLPPGSNFSDFGNRNGQFSWATTLPDTGMYTFHFFADDNRGQVNSRDTVLWNLHVTPPDTGEAPYGLDIPGVIDTISYESDCRLVLPGTNISVPVTYHVANPSPGPDISAAYTGGFELLLRWDPLALTYTGATPALRVNDGSEYFNVIPNPEGPGTVRLLWVADINNGVHTRPALPDIDADFSNPFVYLNFYVASNLPFGMMIPIEFMYTGDFTDNTISDSTGYTLFTPPHDNGCITIYDPALLRGDPNMNCNNYEVADAVIVAQRLIQGLTVWTNDDSWADDGTHGEQNCPEWRHTALFNGAQEAAADLNSNGFADVGDLVGFINILNGISFPPKLDPVTGTVGINLSNGVVTINSAVEIGAALVKMEGEVGQVNAGGMNVMTHSADGVTSVLVYSLAGNRVSAGVRTLFTFSGEGAIVEVSAADSYGRLLDVSARPTAQLPTETGLGQNYPNPFNPATMLKFSLVEAGEVQLIVYDIAGRKIQTLVSTRLESGFYDITWDGRNGRGEDVASGVYFARLVAGGKSESVKMSLVR